MAAARSGWVVIDADTSHQKCGGHVAAELLCAFGGPLRGAWVRADHLGGEGPHDVADAAPFGQRLRGQRQAGHEEDHQARA